MSKDTQRFPQTICTQIKIVQGYTIVGWTMVGTCNYHGYHGWKVLLNEQCCLLLVQQSCSELMKQQWLIEQACMFAIVIIVAQLCR